METRHTLFGVMLCLILGAGCTAGGALIDPFRDAPRDLPPDSTLAYTVFLIGDAGSPRALADDPVLSLLKRQLDAADAHRSAVVFLGDNIYPSGLPARSSPERPEAERRIRVQLEAVEAFGGQIFFVPGNHDYGGLGLGGNPTALRRQEKFVQSYLGRGNAFVPSNGFPGPLEIELTDGLTLIALDTQWWLEDQKRRGDTGAFIVEGGVEVAVALEDVLRRRADEHLLVVAHHPMYSNGTHGGTSSGGFKLPLGFTRQYLGTPQDLSNRKYRIMRDILTEVFAQHDGLIYAAGHEHTLQYFPKGEQHYIVSGAGTKTDIVRGGGGAAFVDEGKGFARLRYYSDGSVWLAFWKPDPQNPRGRMIYRRRIEAPTRPLVGVTRPPAVAALPPDTVATGPLPAPDTLAAAAPDTLALPPRPTVDLRPFVFATTDTVTIAASLAYRAGPLKRIVLGKRYRRVWETEERIPVLDLERTAGGLTPVRRGGSFQTVSLRLKGGDGDEYVLRLIDKNPSKVVPRSLRRTIAQDLVEDQISAAHPYGAFVVAPLAEAGGVYHTDPRLVVVPDDPRLGIYREEFAGMPALFESHPDDDQSDEERFGRPNDIINFLDLFDELRTDNDHRIDQGAFARARLFDMLIGDVDRHYDQWRWAAFEPYELDPTLEGEARTQGKIYRPIPRDRDFAFVRLDGIVGFMNGLVGSEKTRRFKSRFGPKLDDLRALSSSSSALDRSFTAGLSRQAWIAEAESLALGITDDVIERAVRRLPAGAYDRTADQLIEGLKARRDQLPEAAWQFYAMLARVVDVVGSDKHERFDITRLDDGRAEVVMYKVDKDGEPIMELYRRRFDPRETKEVHLYGLDGKDHFFFTGDGPDTIRIRAIGGEDHDTFIDDTGGRASEKTILYDTPEGNTWSVGEGAKIVRSHEARFNRYVSEPVAFNHFGPSPSFAYTTYDGLFLGVGLSYTRQGFKKTPYAQSHRLFANYAWAGKAYNVGYVGHFPYLIGHWEGHLRAGSLVGRDFREFYGLGNGTENTPAVRDRYRTRLQHWVFEPMLLRKLPWFREISFGPYVALTDVRPPREDPFAFPEDDGTGDFSADDFKQTTFAGLRVRFVADGTDTLSVTQSGARWFNEASFNRGVHNTTDTFVRLVSELSYFYTFNMPRTLTLALRTGGATNLGSFAFYQANVLGGLSNLRGYERTRFAGHSSFYSNAELRVALFDFNAYLTRGTFGAFAFFDNGRVWADDARSDGWHQGYGGGIYINPFYRAVVTTTFSFSKEEQPHIRVRLGFLF